MAIIKCKMCGGDIELSADKTHGTCDSCGSTMTFPKVDDEHRANLFNRANHFRRQNEFDKAVSAYERILNEDDTDAEAHWGVVLSRFGIEYVEDPVTHERIPTCHRVQVASILTDEDYLAALQHAPDGYSCELYETEAKRIADIQKGILAISAQEKPYDVFICYKESTDGGSRTKDSTLAQDIYYQLKQEGFNVFFARITLEDKLGQQYEPYIFAALNSAKVMLVVGTKPEYFNAVWVKNEWSRYLALMKQDRSRLLIPCYRDMDAYDLPDELSALQSQDMSKIGFMQDLIRGVKKVLGGNDQTNDSTSLHAPGMASLLKRAKLFLEDEAYDSADEYTEKVLDIDPECAEAYLIKTLIEHELHNETELSASLISMQNDTNFAKALRFADEQQKASYIQIAQSIENNIHLAELEEEYQNTLNQYRYAQSEANFASLVKRFAALNDYKDSKELAEKCAAKSVQLRKEREEREARERLRREQEAAEKAAREEQQRLERKRQEEQAKIAREKARKRNKKLLAILAVIVLIVMAAGLYVKEVFLPQQEYNKAVELLASGSIDETITAFIAMDGWGDSAMQLQNAYFAKGEKQLAAGELSAALASYEKAGEHAEAQQQHAMLASYMDAVALQEKGSSTQARHAFAALGDFLDSAARYESCCAVDYLTANTLLENHKGASAHTFFLDLGNYSDSAERAAAIEADYASAEELMTAGNYEEAAAIFLRLGDYEESAQRAHDAQLQIAEGVFAAGNYDDAITRFEALDESERVQAAKDAKHAYLCSLAEAELTAGNYDAAIEQFEALNETERVQAAKDAKHAYLCSLAEAELAAGNYDAAIEQFEALNETERAQAAKDAKHAYLCSLAEAELTAGNYDAAITQFEALNETERVQAAKDAQYAEYLRLADEALASQQYETSLNHYLLLPQTNEVKAKEYALAQAAYAAGSFEQAVKAYEILGQYELSVSRLPTARYAWADQLFDSGEYTAAAAQFELLGDFSDSEARKKESHYEYAKMLMEAASYDEARSIFSSLGKYEDAASLYKECNYREAAALMANGDYTKASILFGSLHAYADSATQRQECDYRLAEESFAAANYADARIRYDALGDYKDAAAKEKLSTYKLADVRFAAADYQVAKKLYTELGDYEYSAEMVLECRLQKALVHQQKGQYEQALTELEDLEHRNSTQVRAECNLALGDAALKQGNTVEAVRYYTQAVALPKAQENIYAIGKDYAVTNQMEKAIETLWLAGDYEPAQKYLMEIGHVLESNGQTLLACISYIAAGEDSATHYNMLLETTSVDEVLKMASLFSVSEDVSGFLGPMLYPYAEALQVAGRLEGAINTYTLISNYKDSEEKVKACKYDVAVALMNEGKYLEAYEAFVSLNGYKDSAAQATVAYQQYKEPELKKVSVGAYITFGTYEQDNNTSNGKEDIEWLVLAKESNRLLVISRYGLDAKPYNEKYTDVTWETCTLRKWLNSVFLETAFSSKEQALIPKVKVSADKNPGYNTKPGNATQDKIFLLSIPEVNKYFATDSARQCMLTAYAKKQGAYADNSGSLWWWLRSPGNDQNDAAYVGIYGGVVDRGYRVYYGDGAVRPALWINLEP